jgi:arylsulfatase A-like enzyme
MTDMKYTRRAFLSRMSAAAAGLSIGLPVLSEALPALGQSSRPARRPNIIFILADDLGYSHLGCYGQKEIATPNIDRLAAEGMRFTDFYAGSSVCAPSRCSLLTGLHTGHCRIRGNTGVENQRISLESSDLTIAEVLKTRGYATGVFGKWGVGEDTTDGVPNRKGFDEFFGYLNNSHAHNHYTNFLYHNEKRVNIVGNQDGRKEVYTEDLFTRNALDFIRRHRDEPFFLFLPYTAPHAGLICPSDAPYSDKPWPAKAKMMAAMISRQDGDVGKILALLKELGLEQDSLVIYASDNGAPASKDTDSIFNPSGPLRGKKTGVFEGSLRVPLIARWTGHIPAGAINTQPWAFWDIAATAAEIAGAGKLANTDGLSMLATLTGGQGPEHEFFYWEYHDGTAYKQAVRLGRWKALRDAPASAIELYDLQTDLAETHNVAADHPDVIAKINSIMAREHVDSEDFPVHKVVPNPPVKATTKPSQVRRPQAPME